VEAFFSGQPFRGSDCAFGEAAAGFRVMTEIDSVGRRFEDDFVQADYVAFAEGCDFYLFFAAAGLANDLLERDCRAGGRIFFVGMVALENLAGIIVV
jgi:hypothetical protein